MVSIQGWTDSRVKKSIAKVKLAASAQDPVFRFTFTHSRVCVCWMGVRVFSSIHGPCKGICFGSFPAFLSRGVMPFMPHPTVSNGVEKQNRVRPRHDGNAKRQGTESPDFTSAAVVDLEIGVFSPSVL